MNAQLPPQEFVVPKTVATLQNRDIFTRRFPKFNLRGAGLACKTMRKTGEITANLTKVPAGSFPAIERNDYCSEFRAADMMLSASQ